MPRPFTTGQVTRITGLTIRQLRYWDQIGLFSPSVKGTGGRPGVRRLYSYEDVFELENVSKMLDWISINRIGQDGYDKAYEDLIESNELFRKEIFKLGVHRMDAWGRRLREARSKE